MQLLPQWAPNIHPLIIHFPIVLLLTAVVADLGALLFKKSAWLQKTAITLYGFGGLSAVVTYFTGKQAADMVTFPAASYPVIGRHADLALYTSIFFGIYALVRLFLYWKKWDAKKGIAVLLFLIAAAGYGLLQQTAEQGGMLVYKYGVGTQAVKADSAATPTAKNVGALEIIVTENGSWAWNGDAASFKQFAYLRGKPDSLRVQASADGKGLTMEILSPGPFLMTFGPQLANIEMTAQVNLDAFNGRFALVHHVTATEARDFFAIKNGQAVLGRTENGRERSFDTGAVPATAWLTLKAVGSGGHYRGYVNDKLVVHGHGKDLPPGAIGFAFSGKGKIRMAGLRVTSLDETPVMTGARRAKEHAASAGG